MTADANRLTSHASATAAIKGPAPTYPASQVRAFTDALFRLGYDVASLLARAGVRRVDLDDPDAMISCVVLERVIGDALAERRVPNLGAHLAAATSMGAFPLLDYLVLTSDTVGAALEQLVRYFRLVSAPVTLTMLHDTDAIRLLVHPGINPFSAQYETSIIVHHLRAESEAYLRVSYVSLMTVPDDQRDIERLLGCPVRTPSTWSGIEFPCEALDARLRRRDPTLRRVLEGHAAGVAPLATPADDRSTIAAVRSALATQLGRGVPTISTVARQLAKAPRTLQRRLAAEGVSYQQLVDVTRREAAERLLVDASLAIGEIGYLLGFSEPSAFHRAFKRWHEVTPQEYRSARGLV